MNGIEDINDLCSLKIEGQSQLIKEIKEIMPVKVKFIDQNALHRNEITGELEYQTTK